jgi:predicted permease
MYPVSDSKWLIVVLNITAMFVVILIGWLARRRAYFSVETTSALSRFVVEITMPAMVFAGMLSTVDPSKWRESWLLPLIGALIMLIGLLIGVLLMPFVRRKNQRPTFAFLVAASNWIYLPLPIAKALYGNAGERTVLLCNVGATIVLWSLGVWILRRSKPDWASVRALLTNPGLVVTILGLVFALLVPAAGVLANANAQSLSMVALTGKMFITALVILGSLTVPLSLVVTGAQLGGLDLSDHRPSWTLTSVVASRLVLAPVAVVAAIWALNHCGVAISEVTRMVAYMIALMPIAVSCSMFTDCYGGDTSLAARGIFYSMLASILTVPALFYLCQRFNL